MVNFIAFFLNTSVVAIIIFSFFNPHSRFLKLSSVCSSAPLAVSLPATYFYPIILFSIPIYVQYVDDGLWENDWLCDFSND